VSDLTRTLADLARDPERAAVAVADGLLAAALAARASDVHVDPEPGAWVVRFREDGVLREAARLDRSAAPTLVARLKVLADLPTYIVQEPQDGRIPRERARAPGDVRLSVVPTIHGEKAVLRLFEPTPSELGLGDLGFAPDAVAALERAVLSPRGVVVLAGPAGSGKSTTIHAALRRIIERSKGRRSLVSIEDPVERVLAGVTQVQVSPTGGFGFAEALRAILRHDPEVIHLGEVRDARTAQVAIEAGFTGHLVITTLHAGSCAQAFGRLVDMGVEPHLVTSAVSFVMSQRLLRRRCRCGGAPECVTCRGAGHHGRFPIVERVVPSAALKRAVLARADETALEAVLAGESFRTLREAARDAVRAGETTDDEVERVLGPE
jgi:type II secretory ATPase GspE/PulE/Tfp pilus assembly ATPase PilB-like protein